MRNGEITMEERKYEVLVNGDTVAECMDIKTATILMKALFDEYYNEHSMIVSVKEMDRTICVD